MASFISESINTVTAILREETPTLLKAMETPRDPFRGYGVAFAGIMPSPPWCWVMPRVTDFGPEGQVQDQGDAVTVKFGIIGADPEALAQAMLDYVKAVSLALQLTPVGQYDSTVMNIFVERHDYGPLYQKDGGFARFPEVHLVVTRREVIQQ